MTNAGFTNAGFDSDWIGLAEKDPYAVLGISVTAEERRILKRYRQIAKVLHPDALREQDTAIQTFASQVLSRIVNPAYQRLKQEKTRSEALATMRFRVRRLARADQLQPTFESAQQLLRIPEPEVDVFYENTLSRIAEVQFTSAAAFHESLEQLSQLNTVFLRRKMGDIVIREKRTGLIATSAKQSDAVVEDSTEAETPTINYAEKYGIRARTYLTQQNYEMAVQELREALKLEPNNTEFHSMIGQAYFVQKKYGMARAHLKRAAELNPNHPIVQKYLRMVSQAQVGTKRSTNGQRSIREPRFSWLRRLFGG
ncbi:MAG: tetratricopeptide repeat protein [Leptolyngbya sp. SIO4C1]|nr:tetratricopeptide repeat protein [Leptolyngbya sp. SIO4C1]